MRTMHSASMRVRLGISLALLLIASTHLGNAAAQPKGQMTWALHFTIASTYFDPAETPGIITPFLFLYALHDALVKPMPGHPMAPSLAESWRDSDDGLTYEFQLRRGVTFHNGDPFTAEDVKFSLERYRGASAKLYREKVKTVEIVDPHLVRIRLHEPWPDFMTFYGTPSTGAGWIVPKKYVEQVGDDGFKKHPIGAGPYKFVSHQPGIEMVLDAYEGYWRRMPHVKKLIWRSIPDDATRLAMLKTGEADIAYAMMGSMAEEVKGVATYLQAMGIRIKVRPMERAAFVAAWKEKRLPGLTLGGTGAFGNAAVRLEPFAIGGGDYAKGSYPDVDELFKQQSTERDRKKREAMLHEIQRLVHERAMYAPLFELGWPNGVGPRVAESGFGLIPLFYYTGPYEEIRLKE